MSKNQNFATAGRAPDVIHLDETLRWASPDPKQLAALIEQSGRLDKSQVREALGAAPAVAFDDYAIQQGWLSRADLSFFASLLTHATQPHIRVVHKSAHNRAKRAIDIVGATVGLLITAILFLPIAIAIRWDSRGGVLFRQARCGLDGQVFTIWKFRTMAQDADFRGIDLRDGSSPGYESKNKEDSRVTRVGAILRATSLDELPQFWNVLRGDMSLVGTRPPTLYEVAKYRSHHWRRLAVRPGITGEWQVRGRSNISDFERVVELDVEYQRRWSIGYDIRLIALTLWRVLLRRGSC